MGIDEGGGWRTRALAHMGFIGVLQADFTTFKVRGDGEVARIFGVDPDRMAAGVRLDRLDRAYFADDLDVIKRGRQRPRSGLARYEFRLRGPEGAGCIWIRSIAHRSVGRDGMLQEVSGALFDTTAQPPIGPGIHLNAIDDGDPDIGRARPLTSDLDTLSGHLIQATRSAGSLGLRSLEADLRVMLGGVGALLSRRLGRRVHH